MHIGLRELQRAVVIHCAGFGLSDKLQSFNLSHV